METKKRRVLLKLSGEAFGGGGLGVNPDVVAAVAKKIADAAKEVEIAIVVGGGNFFRGAELSNRGMDRGRADYMGMLGTVMNALALQDFIEQAGADVRVQTAISMAQVAAKNGVDGVYSSDPHKNPEAKKLTEISYQDALVQGLKVVDSTAFSLCMDNKMPMRVFGMDNISAALLGSEVGTRVRA